VRGAAAIAVGVALLVAAPAHACVRTVFTETLGKPLSKRAQARFDAQVAKQIATERLTRIAAEVREGRVDVAVGLADMLIPNVRAVRIWQNSCGDSNEYDTLGSAKNLWDGSEFDGTELEGLDPETNGAYYRRIGYNPGACNVEFRASFAALLRARVRPEVLDQAYIALAFDRGDGSYYRYYDFVGEKREPPVKLHGDFSSARAKRTPMWKVLDPQGSVGRAVDEFWASVGPRMADDGFVCPRMRAGFFNSREAWLAELRKRPDYQRLVREAAQRRAMRGQPALKETGK